MDCSPEHLQASPQAAASLEAGSLPCESQAQQGVIYLLLSTWLGLLFKELEPFTDENNSHLWQGSPNPSTSSVPRNRASCRDRADKKLS